MLVCKQLRSKVLENLIVAKLAGATPPFTNVFKNFHHWTIL
jgi:hypothetical protein